MAENKYGEFGEPVNREFLKEQMEKAVEGIDSTAEDALAIKKGEIGDNLFSEYVNIYEKKENLEKRLEELDEKEGVYEELREGKEGKPLRLKEDERRKPLTLKENIEKMRGEKEEKEKIKNEIQEINEKISLVEKNKLLQEGIEEKKRAEKEIETALSGELFDKATEEDDRASAVLGSIVLERYKVLEKRIFDLKQELNEHEKKKPVLEGREGKEIMKFRNEEKKWKDEKEKIEKKIDTIKERIGNPELLDIFKEDEIEEEVDVELVETPTEEVDVELVEKVEKKVETKEVKAGRKKTFLSSIFGFFLAFGHFLSGILEGLRGKKEEKKKK